MWYAGIDWANEHHDALVIDEQGRQVGTLRIEHSPQGMSKLKAFWSRSVARSRKNSWPASSRRPMAC